MVVCESGIKTQLYIEQCLNFMRFFNESTNDTLFLWDVAHGKITLGNNIDSNYIIGSSEDNTYNLKNLIRLIYPKDRADVRKAISQIVKGERDDINIDFRVIDRRGKRIWLRLKGKAAGKDGNKHLVVMGSFSSTAFGRKVDTLTGLFNDIKFKEDMKQLLIKGSSGYLLLVGIDDFKLVNATNGRSYGDYILRKLAYNIEKFLNDDNDIYRIYGDCMAVVLNGASKKEVSELFSSLQRLMESFCTISGGAVALAYEEIGKTGHILQYAENALDYAKNHGKNNLHFFSQELYKKYLDSAKLLEELSDAVKGNYNGFFLCYQPLVDNETFNVRGAEALLRFKSPTRGNVSPAEFIPLLEKSELIRSVGLWVLKKALLSCQEWRKMHAEFRIAVNASYVQMQQATFCDDVLNLLTEFNIPGDALTIEVTENIQLNNFDYYNEMFYKWRNRGIEIAMDDFGSGYSTFSYLKSLNFNKIKIDRSLVSGIDKSAYNFRLISNIVELAHVSNMAVCLEGVETEQELCLAKELRGDILQGYLFDKPLDRKSFEAVYIDRYSRKFVERQEKIAEYKRNLSVMGSNGSHLAWIDDKTSSYNLVANNSKNILRRIELGLWIIRYDEQHEHYQMFIDNTMADILGVEKGLTTEENFKFWISRIDKEDLSIVFNHMEKITSTGKIVQVEYNWHHPYKGMVKMRCVGIRAADTEGMICMKGYHRIISDFVN